MAALKQYEVLATDGRTFTMSGESPEHAMHRVADLHRVEVAAWRPLRWAIVIGCQTTD